MKEDILAHYQTNYQFKVEILLYLSFLHD